MLDTLMFPGALVTVSLVVRIVSYGIVAVRTDGSAET